MYMETKIIYSKTKTVAQYSSSFQKKKKRHIFLCTFKKLIVMIMKMGIQTLSIFRDIKSVN